MLKNLLAEVPGYLGPERTGGGDAEPASRR